MCMTNRRALLWGAIMISVAMISVFADWTGGSFWAVFFGIIAMSVADQRRHTKGC